MKIKKPSEPTYPGKVLKAEIERRGITQRAISACVSILNGKLPLTTPAAMQIAAALNIEPEGLMEMQIAYDMERARHNEKTVNRLNDIREKSATLKR